MSAFAAIFECAQGHGTLAEDLRRVHEVGARRPHQAAGSRSDASAGLTAHLVATAAGEPPAAVPQDARGRMAACAGTFYNLGDLAPALDLTAAQADRLSTAELLLRAYERWGDRFVEHVVGEFSFALWDPLERRLLAGRDPLGVHSLFYFWDGETLVAANSIAQVLAHPRVARDPDWAQVGVFLLGEMGQRAMGEATCFAQVRRLLPGHVLRARGGRLETERYWRVDPTSTIRFEADDAYGAAFREVLGTAVADRMRNVTALGANLSGGLDSASLVVLADRMRQAHAPPLPTFSAVFPEVEAYDERDAIGSVLERTNTTHRYLSNGADDLFGSIDAFFDAHDEPTIGFSALVFWLLKTGPAEAGARVVLNGVGADESLMGSLYYFADLLRAGQFGPLHAELAAYQKHDAFHLRDSGTRLLFRFGLRPLAPAWLRRAQRRFAPVAQPEWMPADFVNGSGVLDRIRARPPRLFRSEFHQRMHDGLFSDYTPHLLSYEEAGAAARGFAYRFPFLDSRVVQFLFALPRDQLLRGGVPKVVLRSAVQGLVPEAIRTKIVKSGIPLLIDTWQTTTYRDRIEECLTDRVLDDCPVVAAGALPRLFRAYVDGRRELRGLVWRAFHLTHWLQRHTAAGAPATEAGAH